MATSEREPLVIVTGGTGVVGSALLPHLIQRYPKHRVLLLTRNPEHVTNRDVIAIRADLCCPGMGLDPNLVLKLQRRVSIFVHCGANTRFNLPLPEARASNVDGTRRALQFALGCPRIEQFAHVSTLYIAGCRAGRVTETRLQHVQGYFNAYERSKHEAEDLVIGQAQRIPAVIYRLSSVIGKGVRHGHVRQLIKLVPKAAQFPFIPADPDVPVDLISDEWAAEALAALIACGSDTGVIRHICAGPAHARTVQELIDQAFAAYQRTAGRRAPKPQLMSLSDFDHQMMQTDRQSLLWRTMYALRTFLPHLTISQPFECGGTAAVLRQIGVDEPDGNEVFERVLQTEFRSAS